MRLILPILFISCLLMSNAQAAIYKCQAVDGGITYSQMECPTGAVDAKVMKIRGERKLPANLDDQASRFETDD